MRLAEALPPALREMEGDTPKHAWVHEACPFACAESSSLAARSRLAKGTLTQDHIIVSQSISQLLFSHQPCFCLNRIPYVEAFQGICAKPFSCLLPCGCFACMWLSFVNLAILVRCPPGDFKRPGHIFPLRYHPGGVLVRPGHTEAGVDLARLAGCFPSGCLSEVVDKRDGSMARLPQLLEFAQQHGLKCITIAQLIRYRLQHEEVVREAQRVPISLPVSQRASHQTAFTLHVFRC